MQKNNVMDDSNLEKEKIDLIVIGNQNSGKTSLIKRFVDEQKVFSHYYTPTLGINLEKKDVKIDNLLVSISIWDTAGQQKFLAITKNYFQRADGVLIIFDLTDKNSFDKVSKFWINQVEEKALDETSLIIIGNKVDMKKERVVSQDQAKQMAEKLKLAYFQTSAKTGENVEEAITFIVRQCLKKIRQDPGGQVVLNNTQNSQQRGCIGGIKNMFSNLFKKSQTKSEPNK